MSSEKYGLKPGLIAAALATTAWVAIPASAQEPVDEAPPEASEPELPETTGRAVSEFAKTLKDLPPEERSEAAKMLRVIAQENLPEAALANRPEQAGQGPLNNPQTEEPVEPVEPEEPVEEEEPVEPGEPVEPEPPETTGTVVSEEAKGLQELPPEEIPAAAQHLRETAQENLPEQALTHRPEQAGQGQLNRPETAGPPATRPSAATRPQRPSAASRPQRPQRPQRPARPVRPGRPGS